MPSASPFPVFVATAALALALLSPVPAAAQALPPLHGDLPAEPAPTEVLHRFAPGAFVESVALAPDGTIWATLMDPADFAANRLWRLEPSGAAHELPMAGAGTLALGPDGTLYVNAMRQDPTEEGVAGIYRLGAQGPERIAPAPEGSQLNGISVDPDGTLWAADSRLGRIWRRARGARELEPWLEHDLIAPAGPPGFPGANGVHRHGDALYVTNSSTGEIVRVPVRPDDSAGAPEVHARGVPGDDFAVASDGALYVTTHPYDTVVRVAPGGDGATVIADAAAGVVGPTAAVLAPDGSALYVVTDGGMFGVMIGTLEPADLVPALVRIDLTPAGASR